MSLCAACPSPPYSTLTLQNVFTRGYAFKAVNRWRCTSWFEPCLIDSWVVSGLLSEVVWYFCFLTCVHQNPQRDVFFGKRGIKESFFIFTTDITCITFKACWRVLEYLNVFGGIYAAYVMLKPSRFTLYYIHCLYGNMYTKSLVEGNISLTATCISENTEIEWVQQQN